MAEPPARSLTSRAALGAAWLAATALTIPGPASALDPGLDGSWRWALNALPGSSVGFGEVVFPYGPLGFVLLPAYGSAKAAYALAAQWLLHAIFGLALWRALRTLSVPRAWWLASALVFAHWAGMVYESQLAVAIILLVVPGTRGSSTARWPFALAGLLAGLALLAKLSLGTMAFGSIAILALCEGRTRSSAALGLGAGVMSLTLASAVFFGSAGQFWSWGSGSFEIARGFSEAMSLPAGGESLARALGGLALYTGLAAWLTWQRFPLRNLAWLCAPAVGLAYAHAVTRLDPEHGRLFAPLLLVALGLLAAFAERGERALTGGAFLVWAMALAPSLGPGAAPPLRWLGRDIERRWDAVAAPGAAAAAARQRSRTALAPLRLGEPFIDAWRSSRVTVDVLPFRLGYLPANDLEWRPNPTLQLTAALTSGLDGRGEAHFCSDTRPDRLLVRFEDIDGRNMVWDTPRIWRAIAACYEPDPASGGPVGPANARVRALARRSADAAWTWTELGRGIAEREAWIDVPVSEDWVFAELDLEPSVLGRLAGPVLPAPALWLEVELTSDARERWRIVRRTAADGLQVAPLPAELRHLNSWWNGNSFPGRRARRLRWVVEGGSWAFRSRAEVRFRAGRIPPLTPPGAPRSDDGAAR